MWTQGKFIYVGGVMSIVFLLLCASVSGAQLSDEESASLRKIEFKYVLKVLILPLVLLGVYWGFRLLERRKRRQEKEGAGNVDDLKPGKVSRSEEWIIEGTPAHAISAMVKHLAALDGRISQKEPHQMIVFMGSQAEARLRGVWNIPALKLPIRVAAKVNSEGSGTRVSMRLDEDFGYQIGLPKVFVSKYNEAFEEVLRGLRGCTRANPLKGF